MVQEVLARHPAMGFVSNLDDRLAPLDRLGGGNGALYRRLPPSVTQKGRMRFAPSEGYRILDRQVSPIISMPPRDLRGEDVTPWLATRFSSFFERRLESQRAEVFLHKFTGWPRARFVDGILPEARFIHIVRDGRAVVNSWLQMTWWLGHRGPDHWQWGPLSPDDHEVWERSGRSFAVLGALGWRTLMTAFDSAAAGLGDRWLELRYEDVVRDPRASFATMLEFCGVAWNPAFEHGFAQHRFSTGRQDAYRVDLGAAEVAAVERVLADLLVRYGYHSGRPKAVAAR
jgi:hypothetical protein